MIDGKDLTKLLIEAYEQGKFAGIIIGRKEMGWSPPNGILAKSWKRISKQKVRGKTL